MTGYWFSRMLPHDGELIYYSRFDLTNGERDQPELPDPTATSVGRWSQAAGIISNDLRAVNMHEYRYCWAPAFGKLEAAKFISSTLDQKIAELKKALGIA